MVPSAGRRLNSRQGAAPASLHPPNVGVVLGCAVATEAGGPRRTGLLDTSRSCLGPVGVNQDAPRRRTANTHFFRGK